MMTSTTFHFDGQRMAQRLMAESALRAATAGGDTAAMLGDTESVALACMAGAALARVAMALLPYTTGFDAEALTMDVLLSPGADSLLAFRLAESAIAALLAGCDDEGVTLARAARKALRGPHGVLRITPC